MRVFERVHTVTDYCDGPRRGLADLDGVAHVYESEWNAERDDYAETFLLSPIDPDTLALALEDWAIWQRWQEAFFSGRTDRETHPALPADRERHEELEALLATRLEVDSNVAVRKLGEFRPQADAGARPRGAMRPLEVRWYDPA